LSKRFLISIAVLFTALGFTYVSSLYSGYLAKSEMLHFWVYFPQRGKPTTLTIDVNKQGILKRLLNPWVEAMSTHWIINTDNKPHTIRLELRNCTIPVEWEVSAGIPWNPSTKTFEQPIEPGKGIPYLGVDWIFHIPPEMRSQSIWYQGGLAVIDANTNETLTFIPIVIYGGWGPD